MRKLLLLALLLAPSAWAGDVVDRARVGEMQRGMPVRVATLAPVLYAHLPILPQVIMSGGSTTIVSGTTPITGGADTQGCYNKTGTLKCGDAGFVYNDATSTLTATNIGAATFTGVNTFSSSNTFSGIVALTNSTGGSGNGVQSGATLHFRLFGDTSLTPDGAALGLGTTANTIQIAEDADLAANFDFQHGRCGTSACGDPTPIIRSRNQSTTQYVMISSQNATGTGEIQTNLANVSIGGSKATITEASAQAIIRVGIPTSTNVYGMRVLYTISDINGANYVGRSGAVTVQGGNSSGTATCTINVAQDTEAEDGSQIVTSNAATLTYTWTNVVSTTNCDLSLNAASSEGANTLAITWTAIVTGNSSAITVTAQ